MLFYMVASSWVTSKDSNLNCVRSFNKETKQIDFKFSVLGKFSVNVMVKHSDNYNGLEKSYKKKVESGKSRMREKDFYVVMNFDEEKSKQLKSIQQSPEEGFKVIEIDVANQEHRQTDIFEYEPMEMEFDEMLTEFKDMPASQNFDEKSKGGKKRHEKTTIIKNSIIKLMLSNRGLIKGKTIQQRADKIDEKLAELFDEKDDEDRPYSRKEMSDKISNFAKVHGLDSDVLEQARDYFTDDRSERIYKWCLEISKEAT